MSELKPVPRSYDPGYPRQLTEAEIERLLRPSLWDRFGRDTLVAGTLLAAGIGCNGQAAPLPAPAELPRPGLSTRKDPNLEKRVQRICNELLGDKVGFWNPHSELVLHADLAANPPIKYPHIPISFGNSYVGIFDVDKAREATRKLFSQWGIELQKDISVKGPGYEFVPDGYNKELRLGFKIIVPERAGLEGKPLGKEPPERALDDTELPALNKDVENGRLRIFVIKAAGFPNMDNDLYTPMEYYLASVIDYLNWVHGDKQIDRNKVLGKERKQAGRKDGGRDEKVQEKLKEEPGK